MGSRPVRDLRKKHICGGKSLGNWKLPLHVRSTSGKRRQAALATLNLDMTRDGRARSSSRHDWLRAASIVLDVQFVIHAMLTSACEACEGSISA